MKTAAALLTLVAVGLLLAPTPSPAASFDCTKAKAPEEIAVCANPVLSALDSEMGGLWFAYSRFPMLMGGSGNRRDEARAFLAERAGCGDDIGCLGTLYRQRIATLQSQIVGFIGRLPPP